MIGAARTAALAQPIALAGEAATAVLIQQAASSLILLTRQITDLDKQITGVFRQHRHARILESVPGIGTRSGAELIAITGGDLTSFGSAAKLAPTLASPRCRMTQETDTALCADLSATTVASGKCSTWLRSTAPNATDRPRSSTSANEARNARLCTL